MPTCFLLVKPNATVSGVQSLPRPKANLHGALFEQALCRMLLCRQSTIYYKAQMVSILENNARLKTKVIDYLQALSETQHKLQKVMIVKIDWIAIFSNKNNNIERALGLALEHITRWIKGINSNLYFQVLINTKKINPLFINNRLFKVSFKKRCATQIKKASTSFKNLDAYIQAGFKLLSLFSSLLALTGIHGPFAHDLSIVGRNNKHTSAFSDVLSTVDELFNGNQALAIFKIISSGLSLANTIVRLTSIFVHISSITLSTLSCAVIAVSKGISFLTKANQLCKQKKELNELIIQKKATKKTPSSLNKAILEKKAQVQDSVFDVSLAGAEFGVFTTLAVVGILGASIASMGVAVPICGVISSALAIGLFIYKKNKTTCQDRMKRLDKEGLIDKFYTLGTKESVDDVIKPQLKGIEKNLESIMLRDASLAKKIIQVIGSNAEFFQHLNKPQFYLKKIQALELYNKPLLMRRGFFKQKLSIKQYILDILLKKPDIAKRLLIAESMEALKEAIESISGFNRLRSLGLTLLEACECERRKAARRKVEGAVRCSFKRCELEEPNKTMLTPMHTLTFNNV